ncbi:MAG TPA: NADH-quinone oxidoreductase subunit N [Longimicrobiales bacterium]
MQIDYTSQTQYFWVLLPEILLSAWAMLVLLTDVFQKGDSERPSSSMMPWLTLVGFAIAAVANGYLLTMHEVGTQGMMVIDTFRVFSNFLFLLAGAMFVLISTRYIDQEQLRLGELYVLAMFSIVGMMVFAGSRDLMVSFIGLELMSVPVYVLTGINRRSFRSAEGALKYFMLGAFSSAFFLFGIALVYGATGTTNLAMIATAISADATVAGFLLPVGIALLAVGFGFKVAAVPFHMWTPDAYEGAPVPVTAFMSTAIKAAAFAAFLRVFLTAFPGLYDTWDTMAIWLAIITMVVANLTALVEGNVKRLLAYSSIAHAGYLLVALAAGSEIGAASFLFYLVVYTLMTIGAFAVVMAVGRRGEERMDLQDYAGLATSSPLLAIVMTIFLLSLAGFPLTGGFIGKVFILRAAIDRGLVLLSVVLVVASIFSYYYYLRIAWYMWFREPEGGALPEVTLSPALRATLVFAAIAVIVLGIFPGQLLDAAQQSAQGLMQVPAALVDAAR